MPSQDDLRFGSLAVQKKLAKPEHVSECLQVQADEDAAGKPRRSLGEIMVKKGYLWPQDVAKIVDEQARQGGGKTLGPYQLLGKLGEGGMGAVHRARLNGTNIEVALKILPEHLVADATLLARFKREASLGKELFHPHVVRTLDFGEDRGVHFITLELVEGGDLDKRLKKEGKLSEKVALEIVRDVAKGLQHAHERGLVHRDIKPSNIMFDRAGTPKLADFGLVKHDDPNANNLTQTGQVMGTPNYLSPEQAQGSHDLDIRSDIYSLGATLFHVVAGRPPHLGATPYEVVVKHVTEPLQPPKQVNPALSAACSALIVRMMSKDRVKRHAAPQDVVEDIERILRGQGIRPVAPVAVAQPLSATLTHPLPPKARQAEKLQPKKKEDPVPLVLAGIGIGLLFLLAAWLLWPSGQQPEGSKKTAQQQAPPATPDPPVPSPTAVKKTAPAPPVVTQPEPEPEPAQPEPTPGPPAPAEWTDLLAALNPARDAVNGDWRKVGGALRLNGAQHGMAAAIEVGDPPGEEYDYRVSFTVERDGRDGFGAGEVCQQFNASGKQARFALWCFDYHHLGFVWDSEHFRIGQAHNNPTFVRRTERLHAGQRYTSLVEVRRGEVRGYLDDERISTWRPDDWPRNDMWAFNLNNRRLGVGAWQSNVTFHAVEVRPHRAEAP